MEDFEQLLNESSEEILEISTDNPTSVIPKWRSDLPSIIPVMPLPGIVLFPGTVTPLTIERPSSKKLLNDLLPKNRLLGLVSQKNFNEESPKSSGLYDVGVLGKALRMKKQKGGKILLLLQIVERAKFNSFEVHNDYFRAKFDIIENISPKNNDVWKAVVRNLYESAEKFIIGSPSISNDAIEALKAIDSDSVLTDFLATNLSLDLQKKQALLEEVKVSKRADEIQRVLNNQLHIFELQEKLKADVEDEFSDAQRRAYLREQLRAIQRELGEEEEDSNEDLYQRLEKADLPDVAMQAAEKELKKLDFIPASSPDHSVIVTYLETLLELPWNELSKETKDFDKARKILDKGHFGLEKVKRRLIEYLAVRKLNPKGRGPILCLLGPPGVGKTSLGKSIAEALGREFIRISVGGLTDESEIRGHRRTYIGSMPGRVIQEIKRAKKINPIIMLDEVDKIGNDFRGDPSSALLEVLDPHQNHTFMDRYLDVPFDLSQVIFIATANSIDPIPAPLRDRMELIEIPGYTSEEKIEIALRYLIKRQLKENGLKRKHCSWYKSSISELIESYTRESGVRNLEREIGSICRYVASKVVNDDSINIKINPKLVEEILGPKKYLREEKMRKNRPGIVNGLAYTAFGGEVLNVEAIKYDGKGNIKLTGQIGNVMKESMQAAWSLVKSRSKPLGIDNEVFNKFDVHVHVPAGAVPKDGPSAGCAMYTALASLFANKSVNKDIGMTGEINLRGDVLPIGGLKEKALGALQAGIYTILIPEQNTKDISDIPESAKKKLKIITVTKVEEILKLILLD